MNSTLIKKLHAHIRGSFIAKWDQDADAACAYTLGELAKKYPADLEAGVHEYIRREQFWSPAKLQEYVVAQGKKQYRAETDPNCNNCGGHGWAKADDKGRVQRCHCWRKVSA